MLKRSGALFGRTESVLLAAILVTAVVFSLSSPYFFTLSNLVNLIEAYSVTTILAAGAFVVLVSGGIDVSFTATASASQYLAAYLIAQVGCPAAPALALGAILGVALGCINALLTYYLRIVSIIVTIATSSIYYALLIYFTNAEEIYNLPDWWSGRITFLRFATASGVVKITLPIVVMVAVVLLTQYLMAWTRIGRQVYALGGNPDRPQVELASACFEFSCLLTVISGFLQPSPDSSRQGVSTRPFRQQWPGRN